MCLSPCLCKGNPRQARHASSINADLANWLALRSRMHASRPSVTVLQSKGFLTSHQRRIDHALSEIHQDIKTTSVGRPGRPQTPRVLGTDRQTPGIYLATRGLRQEGRVGRLSRPRGESVQRLTQLWVCLQVRWTTSESGALHARPPDDLDGESRVLFTSLGGFLLESAAAFPAACPFRG